MKARIASVAFLLGSLCTGLVWLTLQPFLLRLLEAVRRSATPGSPEAEVLAQARGVLPFVLVLDLVLASALAYLVLDLMVRRPLRRTEEAVEALGRLQLDEPLAGLSGGGGPLLSRVQGALTRMAAALRDERALTRTQLEELRATNARLARAHTELAAAERLATVGKLSAGIAHEVGNPLSGLLGYLSLLRTKVGAQPQAGEFLDRMEAEVQRIDGILRSLLDLGRAPRSAPSPVEVSALVRGCVQMVRAGADFEGVDVQVELEPAVARADPGPLTQVLINLLLNAAQAMGGRGRVWVRVRRQGEEVHLFVEDEGPGLPPEVLPRLFEPFFTTKESGRGTGLGLSVSLHLVTQMGGSLEADNRSEGGACFRVRLPAA